jgi:hypothetical protein
MVMDFHDDEYNVEQSNGPHSCLWSSQPDSDIAFNELISSKMSSKLNAPPECHETLPLSILPPAYKELVGLREGGLAVASGKRAVASS